MKLIKTAIPDVVVIEPKVFEDGRGFFFESYNDKAFRSALLDLDLEPPRSFVQDNHSSSKKGVLRGLHFQAAPYAQGKLVRVIKGAAFDVAVDIRKNSATYGKWVGETLSENNRKMLWIPEGFAHGFLALEDDTHFIYKTTDYYNTEAERSILWSDPALNIAWPMSETEELVISPKDAEALPLENFNLCQKI